MVSFPLQVSLAGLKFHRAGSNRAQVVKQSIEKLLCPFLRFEGNERSARSQRRRTCDKELVKAHPQWTKEERERKIDELMLTKKYKPKQG